MSINTNAASRVWASYLDVVDDVIPWLREDQNDPSLPVRLQIIVDMACQFVQNFLARPIAPTRFDQRFDGWTGWNGAYLELPWYPVLEIVSVVEYWGVSGPHVLSESTPTEQVDGFQLRPTTGRVTRVFSGLVQKPWFPGSGNIEIVWVAGFNPVPADIKVATLELCAYWWRNTQQQSATRSGTGTGPSDEYAPATQSGLWAGIPDRIVDLLEPYLHVGIG